MFENEEWKHIDELPHYLISDHARVKMDGKDAARKVTISDSGFPIVTLYGKDSKTRYLRQINVLVARAFLRPPRFAEETAVWHIDGDLTNCLPYNLKWDTRYRVLKWNEMHRRGTPEFRTPPVRNNRTGKTYANAYECAMDVGDIEDSIIAKVEVQARHDEDDNARYRYVRDWLG